MQTLFSRPLPDAQISIILLDWSCRESFHIFDYLDKQTVARNRYEVILLEYFDRKPEDIARRIESGTACPDIWVVLEIPQDAYYHKHFSYNAGILLAHGRIIVICDSDAIVNPTFVESILKAFDRDEEIVLHLDEVRNIDRRHYPFNYPTIAEFLAGTCINWNNGITSGLREDVDIIHDRNYGACFCALKDDLIAIGGADEHIDYLGHICGPYDFTFRLVSAGKREVWLKNEFLYHTWHPGTDGKDNYLGPHDGRNVSSRALNAKFTRRVMPYLESLSIACYRETGDLEQSLLLLTKTAEDRAFCEWRKDDTKRLLSLGREAYYRGKFKEAVNHWKQLTDIPETRSSEVLTWMGWGLLAQKENFMSIRMFEEAIVKDSANNWACCGLGQTLLALGRHNEALEYFDDILDGNLTDLIIYRDALEGRGELLQQLGRLEDAQKDFSALCTIYEQYSKNRCRLAYYRLGLCELKLGNRAAARTAFSKACSKATINPHLMAVSLKAFFFLHRVVSKLRNILRRLRRRAMALCNP